MSVKKSVASHSAVAIIIAAVFSLEGGYVNDPKDPGGETNHGITVKVARAHGYTGEMKDLPKELAYKIIEEDYVSKPGYTKIIDLSSAVGHKLVDVGVNAGPYRSSTWFQTALNSLNRGGKDYPSIMVNGVLSDSAATSYALLQKKRGSVKACEMVLKLMDAQQAVHYMGLTKMSSFTVGWVDHRVGNIPKEQCNANTKSQVKP